MSGSKRKNRIREVIFFILLMLLCCGCRNKARLFSARDNSEAGPVLLPVTIVDAEHVMAEQRVFRVEYGDSLTVPLRFEEGYTLDTCSYPEYVFDQKEGRLGDLILPDICFPVRIEVTCRESGYGVCYMLNGGEFLEGEPFFEKLKKAMGRDEGGEKAAEDGNAAEGEETAGGSRKLPTDHFFIWHEVGPHLRPNTSIGTDTIWRDGYTQTGWNSKADGSGEHIGLGSRVTVEKGSAVTLYAEWAKWLPDEFFETEETENGTVRLLSYTGPADADPFVIPAYHDGKIVTEIAEGFADSLSGEVLVLPPGILKMETNAFTNASFTEAYLFDDMEEVTNESISAPFHTLHVNAIRVPQYLINDNAQFAENVDKLMLAPEGRKKMVFFAGCSFSYGLVSQDIADVYGREYEIFDLGVIGGGNAPIQYDNYRKYLGEGDIFVHAPEASQHQLMSSYGCDMRLFIMTEGNYDLLSETDAEYLENFWNSLQEFNESRDKLTRKLTYLDITPHYNSYGDIKIPRQYTNQMGVSFSDYSYFYRANSVTEEAAACLCSWYMKLKKQGVTVLLSFSPMNRDGLDTAGKKNSPFYFESFISNILVRYDIPVISEMKNYVMGSEFFYDSDYHMNEVGAKRRTELLLKDLEAYVPVPEKDN